MGIIYFFLRGEGGFGRGLRFLIDCLICNWRFGFHDLGAVVYLPFFFFL